MMKDGDSLEIAISTSIGPRSSVFLEGNVEGISVRLQVHRPSSTKMNQVIPILGLALYRDGGTGEWMVSTHRLGTIASIADTPSEEEATTPLQEQSSKSQTLMPESTASNVRSGKQSKS